MQSVTNRVTRFLRPIYLTVEIDLADPADLAAELIVIYDGALAGRAPHSDDPLGTAQRLACVALRHRRAAVP